ncbi:hypothetical protein ACI2KR_27400 [Pseudomonas luteola]
MSDIKSLLQDTLSVIQSSESKMQLVDHQLEKISGQIHQDKRRLRALKRIAIGAICIVSIIIAFFSYSHFIDYLEAKKSFELVSHDRLVSYTGSQP